MEVIMEINKIEIGKYINLIFQNYKEMCIIHFV